MRSGEDIQGVVDIKGGSGEQNKNISRVGVKLDTEYTKDVEDRTETHIATLVNLVVDRNIVIAPSEEKQIPLKYDD